MKYFFRIYRLLALSGWLLLSACPQMTTGALTGGGAPVNATGEKSAKGDTDIPSSDDVPAPAAAAPVPSTVGGGDAGGLGGAGSGSPEFETAMRRIDGAPVPTSEPVTVARDGAVFSAPAMPERIVTFEGNVRVLSWPASVSREWTDYADFARKLAECQNPAAVCRLTEEVAKQVRVENGPICLEGWEISPQMSPFCDTLIPESQLINSWPLKEFAYSLFFVTKSGKNEELGGGFETVDSLAELIELATDHRLRFSGEKAFRPYWLIPGLLDRNLFPILVTPAPEPSRP